MDDDLTYEPDPRLQEAGELADEGAWEEALARLDELDPGSMDSEDRGILLGLRLAALTRLGYEDEARQLRETLVSGIAENPDLPISAAIECSEHNEYESAEWILRRVYREVPQSDAAHNLGVVLHYTDRPQEALHWFDTALAQDAEFAATHWMRAEVLEELNRLEEAVESWRRYLDLEREDSDAWVSVGIDESELERYDRAVEAFDRAVQLEPDSTHAWYNRGVTASRADDSARLAECVEALHRYEPGGWRALLTAARLAMRQGERQKGWDLCRDAVDSALLGTPEEDFSWVTTHVLDTVLPLAEETGLFGERQELLERALDLGLYCEPVFEALRRDTGRVSARAHLYEVEIVGRVEDPELVEELNDIDLPGGGDYGYAVAYRVWADDAEDAEAKVLEFENEHGPGAELRIGGAQPLAGPEEAICGITWRGEMRVYPVLD